MPDTPNAWVGWQRLPGQRWHAVAEGTTYAEARQKLFDHQYPGMRRDIVILQAGIDPNETKAIR